MLFSTFYYNNDNNNNNNNNDDYDNNDNKVTGIPIIISASGTVLKFMEK